jgi:putative oxygen-independent coproporphyrinogen III oxidase
MPQSSRDTSIYVHFPWCLAKCPYCDFVSYAEKKDAIPHGAYADAVIAQLEHDANACSGRTIRSVFFGGGTPSLWEVEQLGRVLARIRSAFSCAPDMEVTVECNPTSLDEARARALFDAGVGRLSIGTQSLREEQLKFLGRLHDPAGARAAIDGAMRAVPRVSTDMIFGLPQQSPEDARAQAESLAGIGLSHLSCYQLTIEPGTQFGELAKRGRLPLADDGLVADAFLAIDQALGARGFVHYEISNYAKPGEEARHNLHYWQGGEYLGVGCAAYGFLRGDEGGERYRNDPSPKKYMADPTPTSREPLDPETLLKERIMLGLRLEGGFDLEESARDLGAEAWPADRARAADALVAKGRLTRDGPRLSIPKPAWLWTDDTAARLF